ncbi:MAG: hypothetical protein CYG60_16320 [Actinobacteria bacterium]|nr:MAG: hypothetical protein CYG60_16320 [Actinomycetota bacterium]
MPTPQSGKLPDVEFITESGEKLPARELTGSKTVLYFYPKDDAPGCTKEACAFRDRMPDYEGANIKVYGGLAPKVALKGYFWFRRGF